jgi:hypothetical protein
MKESLLSSPVDAEAPGDRIENAEEVFFTLNPDNLKSPQTVFSLLRFLILSSTKNICLLVVILFICIGRQLVIAYVLAPTMSSFIKYVVVVCVHLIVLITAVITKMIFRRNLVNQDLQAFNNTAILATAIFCFNSILSSTTKFLTVKSPVPSRQF